MRIKSIAERRRNDNLEIARSLKSVKGVKIKRPPIPPYKEHSVDPALRQRRLSTLIHLLTLAAKGSIIMRAGNLTKQEMREWVQQCENLLR